MDSLEEIVQQCRSDSIEWFGDETSRNLTIFALGLAGESGEFCDLLKKVMRGSIPMEDASKDLSLELVDVFIYVCNIAALMGMDLGAVYDYKRAYNAERFNKNSSLRAAEIEAVEEGS